jgi:PQQ-dependent dehydrogenase (methanol/ethanol family)
MKLSRSVGPLGVLSLFFGIALSAPLLAAATDEANTDWSLLGRTADMQHESPLKQINAATVKNLGLTWYADMPSPDGLVGNPMVVDGVVYQSGPSGRAYANDLRTGKLLWQYTAKVDLERMGLLSWWARRFNRGLATDGDKVFITSGDCRLIALDRKTGRKVWEVEACDPTGAEGMYGITGAPRLGNGMVFIGNTCGDSGIGRGYVDAYDENTGARKWRFYTVPDDPAKGPQKTPELEVAAKTWGTDWYKKSHGCGSVWEAITYDQQLNRVYLGVDGPSPWNPSMRAADAGDELFTNSIVAVDASTGKYLWHYSVDPHDGWNYGPTSHLMLANLPLPGGTRRVVMAAPKNGFFYVLDAKTGKFISAQNFTPVNWASRIDGKTGRPVTQPEARYWEQPDHRAIVLPANSGAHNWQAMAFNPATGLVYIPVSSAPQVLIADPANMVGGVRSDDYYGFGKDPKWQTYGELVAWDPVKQKARWRVRRNLPMNGGMLTTAGNLVFEGTGDGKFEAYAADSGKLLWSFDAGGAVLAAPSTVNVDGKQMVLVSVGNGGSSNIGSSLARLASVARTRTQARLLAFSLDGKSPLPQATARAIPEPPLPRFPQELAERGALLFDQHNCVYCHGHGAESANGAIKDLRFASAETHNQLPAIVLGGLRAGNGMPPFPDITPDDLKAIQAYIINQAWDGYNTAAKKDSAQTH